MPKKTWMVILDEDVTTFLQEKGCVDPNPYLIRLLEAEKARQEQTHTVPDQAPQAIAETQIAAVMAEAPEASR